MEKSPVFETPEWLGIEEVYLLGKPRSILVNLKDGTVFDIMKTREQNTVARRLMRIKDRDKIKLVSINMWEPYRDIVRAILPQTIIVIDKSHILKMVNTAVDAVRKRTQEGLPDKQRCQLIHDRFLLLQRRRDVTPEQLLIVKSWLNRFPNLKAVYVLKEQIFDIWAMPYSAELAKKQYLLWEKRIPIGIAWAFKNLTTAVTNWESEIFGYFEHRINTDYTKNLGELIQFANQIIQDEGFEVIRAKVLFSMKDAKKAPSEHSDEPTLIIDEIEHINLPGTDKDLLLYLIHSNRVPICFLPTKPRKENEGKA